MKQKKKDRVEIFKTAYDLLEEELLKRDLENFYKELGITIIKDENA